MRFQAVVEIDDNSGEVLVRFDHSDAAKRKPVVTTDEFGRYLFLSGRNPGHVVLELDDDERLVGIRLRHFELQCLEAKESLPTL